MAAGESLSIALDAVHPATLRAAAELARAWREIEGGLVTPTLAAVPNRGPVVRLGLGSLVRPNVVVRYERPFAPEPARAADVLALTIAAWDSLDGPEPWRLLSAPLGRVPHYGRPEWSRPWVVSTSTQAWSVAAGQQLHVVGGLRPPGRSSVWWPRWPRVVAAVLGRAAYVLGGEGPLTYDAARAGVPVLTRRGRVENWRTAGALAGLVPASLLDEPQLWRHVAETAREVHRSKCTPAPLMTPAWVGTGRDRIRSHLAKPTSYWWRLRRRHDKLRRDPRRFFADSRHGILRELGELAFGRRRSR